MSNPHPKSELDDALLTLIDGSTDASHTAALDDPAARRRYLDLVATQVLLVELLETPEVQVDATTPVPSDAKVRVPTYLAIAAALLAACGLAAYLLVLSPDPEPLNPEPSPPPVATLIDVSGGGTMIVNNDIANTGSEYAAGSYAIADGAAELQLTSGANVRVHGRTSMRVLGPMRTVLSRGAARFHCPPSAAGFTVVLPHGRRVVDLGTAFAARVDDDTASRIVVTEGVVRLDTTVDDAMSSILLHAGDSIELPADDRAIAMSDIRRTPLPEGLVALWTFDDPARLAHEAAESIAPLTIVGDARHTDAGRTGGALALDGEGDALAATEFPDLLPIEGEPYTLSAWIKPTETGQRGIVGWGAYGEDGRVNALRLHKSNGFSHYWWGTNAGNDLVIDDAGLDLRAGAWTHVAVTWDGTTRRLYLNGEPIAHDKPSTPDVAAANFAIGVTNHVEYFHGLIDDLAIYRVALDTSDINAAMNADTDQENK